MGLDKVQNNPASGNLPVEKQQAPLNAETIEKLKSRINVFDGKQDAGSDLVGTMDIHKGSLFSFTQTSNQIKFNTETRKTEAKRTSYQYLDTDGNGTFETLIVEVRNAYDNSLISTTKYGKSKDDNVSNYDKEIPIDAEKK